MEKAEWRRRVEKGALTRHRRDQNPSGSLTRTHFTPAQHQLLPQSCLRFTRHFKKKKFKPPLRLSAQPVLRAQGGMHNCATHSFLFFLKQWNSRRYNIPDCLFHRPTFSPPRSTFGLQFHWAAVPLLAYFSPAECLFQGARW